MRAAAAGGAVAGGRRLDEDLVRAQLLHLVEDAAVGGDDEGPVRQGLRRLDQLAGRTHRIGQFDHRLRRLRVHQDGGLRIERLHILQLLGLELFVDDAGTVPQQHVGTGLALDVAPQVLIRRPENLLAVVHQALDDLQRAAGGNHPVGPRLYRCRGIGVHHHGAIGVLVAEGREILNRAAQVERAGGVQGRHQHALFRIEDLGGLAHELDPGHHHGLRRVLVAETGHLQGVGDATTGFLGQSLDHRVAVVMRHQHGVLLLQLGGDLAAVEGFLLDRQRLGLLGGKMGLHQQAFGNLGHVIKPESAETRAGSISPGLGPPAKPLFSRHKKSQSFDWL